MTRWFGSDCPAVLYSQLLRPADVVLQKAARLLIVPDGPLHTLPFAALQRTRGKFLIEWKPVHTALSATVYSELRAERRTPESYRTTIAAFGDAQCVPLPAATGASATRTPVCGKLAPLPASRKEAEEITGLFPNHSLLLGKDATEEAAKTIGKDVRYLHFAVHGLVDNRLPLNSALALSNGLQSGAEIDNGLLQAWELYSEVRWDADLAVLSACDGAIGTDMGSEGLMSLTRAVHYAGAHSVLASLWKVDDQRTADLMVAFYRELRRGRSKDEALRLAQLQLARSHTGASPFFWAAFQLSGDWR